MKARFDQSSLSPLEAELQEAMEGWGCPLCRLVDRAERTFVDSLNYERVLDLKTRDALKASRGVCQRHAQMWRSVQGSALGIAIVYRVAVLDLLRDTAADDARPQGLFRRRPQPADISSDLSASQPCPVCTVGEETEQRFGALLIQGMPEPTVQSKLAACGGLCLPHLRQVLQMPGADRVSDRLMACHREVWENLLAELEEFIRKNDYRFSDEVLTEGESKSWTRALDLLTGRGATRRKR